MLHLRFVLGFVFDLGLVLVVGFAFVQGIAVFQGFDPRREAHSRAIVSQDFSSLEGKPSPYPLPLADHA